MQEFSVIFCCCCRCLCPFRPRTPTRSIKTSMCSSHIAEQVNRPNLAIYYGKMYRPIWCFFFFGFFHLFLLIRSNSGIWAIIKAVGVVSVCHFISLRLVYGRWLHVTTLPCGRIRLRDELNQKCCRGRWEIENNCYEIIDAADLAFAIPKVVHIFATIGLAVDSC